MNSIQGVAVEYIDMQTAVLMSRAEYKTQTYGILAEKFHLMLAFVCLKISSPKRSFWRAVHSCICDGKLAITSQQTFVSDPNFDPEMPFRPLT